MNFCIENIMGFQVQTIKFGCCDTSLSQVWGNINQGVDTGGGAVPPQKIMLKAKV